MVAKVYNIPDHTRRDTFEGFDLTITLNGVPLDLTGASIRMQLRINTQATAVKEFSTTNGSMTITDALNGKFTFNQQIIDVDANSYYYDMQITLGDGRVYTFLKGSWNIVQDYTYND